MTIPVAGPWITEKEVSYVADAVANAWYANAGTYNKKFEEAFARYLGVKYAISLPSCTSAIHLALAALDIGPGDEVVVPDITWIATSAPITYLGATPVFADVEFNTWCLSAKAFEAAITPRTRAVIPVHLYGGMADMEAILAIANRHRIAVVEDAAEAVGSRYKGRLAGAFGKAGTFSFHGSKTLTTGEGGMLTTDDPRLHARIQVLRDHGRSPGDTSFVNEQVAFKYKMSSLQAALGLAQLERIEELLHKKRQIFSWYKERLQDVSGLQLNAEPSGTFNSYWMVTVIFPDSWGSKVEVLRLLKNDGIDARPIFSPLSALPAYRSHWSAARAALHNKVAYALGNRGINLPSALKLSEEDVDRVCNALARIREKADAGR